MNRWFAVFGQSICVTGPEGAPGNAFPVAVASRASGPTPGSLPPDLPEAWSKRLFYFSSPVCLLSAFL